jgi:hypothetical protein
MKKYEMRLRGYDMTEDDAKASQPIQRATPRKRRNTDCTDKKRLTSKQQKFLVNLSNGQTQKQAALNAGYSPKNARQSGYQAIKFIRLRAPEAMDQAGLTVPVLIDKYLRPQLKAKETKYFSERGIVTDRRDLPDNGARNAALDMAFKLQGAYPRNGEGEDHAGGSGLTINVGLIMSREAGILLGEEDGEAPQKLVESVHADPND